MAPKLRVTDVYKIFGKSPKAALQRLRAGDSKQDILRDTGQTVGVHSASFDVEQGQIFVIMGLSGSGKSTLVRMLNGLIKPTAGSITIDGEDVASCSPQALRRIRREKIAMVFQHFALFPHRSILDNAAYGLKVKGVPLAERHSKAHAALEQVGLDAWADSLPSALSGGMQQRVGLARALATEPEVLLMDEPFGALDPLIRKEMQDELLNLQRSLKKTIIFITHDLNEALILGDRIAIMKDGEIVQTGTARDIVSQPANDYVSAFVADIDRGRVFTAANVATEADALQLSTGTAEDAIADMEATNRNAIYVMDGEEIAGVVTYKDLTSAERDTTTPPPELTDVLITDFPTASSDDPLVDLYGSASVGLPIAVTDADNRLVGVVEPDAVFAQLTGDAPAATSVAAAAGSDAATADAR